MPCAQVKARTNKSRLPGGHEKDCSLRPMKPDRKVKAIINKSRVLNSQVTARTLLPLSSGGQVKVRTLLPLVSGGQVKARTLWPLISGGQL